MSSVEGDGDNAGSYSSADRSSPKASPRTRTRLSPRNPRISPTISPTLSPNGTRTSPNRLSPEDHGIISMRRTQQQVGLNRTSSPVNNTLISNNSVSNNALSQVEVQDSPNNSPDDPIDESVDSNSAPKQRMIKDLMISHLRNFQQNAQHSDLNEGDDCLEEDRDEDEVGLEDAVEDAGFDEPQFEFGSEGWGGDENGGDEKFEAESMHPTPSMNTASGSLNAPAELSVSGVSVGSLTAPAFNVSGVRLNASLNGAPSLNAPSLSATASGAASFSGGSLQAPLGGHPAPTNANETGAGAGPVNTTNTGNSSGSMNNSLNNSLTNNPPNNLDAAASSNNANTLMAPRLMSYVPPALSSTTPVPRSANLLSGLEKFRPNLQAGNLQAPNLPQAPNLHPSGLAGVPGLPPSASQGQATSGAANTAGGPGNPGNPTGVAPEALLDSNGNEVGLLGENAVSLADLFRNSFSTTGEPSVPSNNQNDAEGNPMKTSLANNSLGSAIPPAFGSPTNLRLGKTSLASLSAGGSSAAMTAASSVSGVSGPMTGITAPNTNLPTACGPLAGKELARNGAGSSSSRNTPPNIDTVNLVATQSDQETNASNNVDVLYGNKGFDGSHNLELGSQLMADANRISLPPIEGVRLAGAFEGLPVQQMGAPTQALSKTTLSSTSSSMTMESNLGSNAAVISENSGNKGTSTQQRQPSLSENANSRSAEDNMKAYLANKE